MENRRELLLGCGTNHDKKLVPRDLLGVGKLVIVRNEWKDWSDLTTLDYRADYASPLYPHVVWDLEDLRPLPFRDDTFDEIHAYEVLEHIGAQGDWRTLFRQFGELWRILKPGGLLIGTTPCWKSMWAWSDPSHKRVISEGTLTFLSQESYGDNKKAMTPMSDFQEFWKADFQVVQCGHTTNPTGQYSHDTCNFIFFLKAIKA